METCGRGINWVEFATVHCETRFVIVLLASAAAKNIYTVRLITEVAKMFGARDRELNELAVVVAQRAFWSNVLHVQNYDYKELEQIGKHMSKQK